MGTAIQTGNVTASISGSVSYVSAIPSGATQIIKHETKAAATTTDVHTVTVGKTLYITSVSISISANATATAHIEVDDGSGTYIVLASAKVLIDATVTTQNATMSVSFPIPISVAASDKVRHVSSSASCNSTVTFTGYEV